MPVKIATACFLRQQGKTLFIDYTLSQDHPIHAGKYAPPGGKLKEGESNENGSRREVLEETGIIARNLISRGTVKFLNEKRTIKGKSMNHNWMVYFFDCNDFDASNARATEGRLAWVENEKVPDLPLHEGDKIIWEWLNKYSEFEGEIEHEGEKLMRGEITYLKV